MKLYCLGLGGGSFGGVLHVSTFRILRPVLMASFSLSHVCSGGYFSPFSYLYIDVAEICARKDNLVTLRFASFLCSRSVSGLKSSGIFSLHFASPSMSLSTALIFRNVSL